MDTKKLNPVPRASVTKTTYLLYASFLFVFIGDTRTLQCMPKKKKYKKYDLILISRLGRCSCNVDGITQVEFHISSQLLALLPKKSKKKKAKPDLIPMSCKKKSVFFYYKVGNFVHKAKTQCLFQVHVFVNIVKQQNLKLYLYVQNIIFVIVF